MLENRDLICNIYLYPQSCTTTEGTIMSLCLWSKTWPDPGRSPSPRPLTLSSLTLRSRTSPTQARTSSSGTEKEAKRSLFSPFDTFHLICHLLAIFHFPPWCLYNRMTRFPETKTGTLCACMHVRS